MGFSHSDLVQQGRIEAIESLRVVDGVAENQKMPQLVAQLRLARWI